MNGLLGYQSPQTVKVGDLNVRRESLLGMPTPTVQQRLQAVAPPVVTPSIAPVQAAPLMPVRAPALGEVSRGRRGLFTGPGASERLMGIAQGLLTGPSRTPVSFGQSLSSGLLLGQQMAQQAETLEQQKQDLLFKRQKEKAELEKIQAETEELRREGESLGAPRPQDVVGYQYIVDKEGKTRPVYFDKRLRRSFFADTQKPVDEAVTPISQFQRPDNNFFREARESLTTEEQAFDSMDRYLVGLANDPKGMARFFNKVSQKITTAFKGTPTLEEMATAINEGRLQGLIGQVREEVVGPGVMTEFDAERILMSLGGDYTVFQSPEAAIQLIGEVRDRKYNAYQELLGEYNRGLDTLDEGSPLKTIYQPKTSYELSSIPPKSWFEGGGTLDMWKNLSAEEKAEFGG